MPHLIKRFAEPLECKGLYLLTPSSQVATSSATPYSYFNHRPQSVPLAIPSQQTRGAGLRAASNHADPPNRNVLRNSASRRRILGSEVDSTVHAGIPSIQRCLRTLDVQNTRLRERRTPLRTCGRFDVQRLERTQHLPTSRYPVRTPFTRAPYNCRRCQRDFRIPFCRRTCPRDP